MSKALLVKKVEGDFDNNGNVVNKKIMQEVEEFTKELVQFLQESKAWYCEEYAKYWSI